MFMSFPESTRFMRLALFYVFLFVYPYLLMAQNSFSERTLHEGWSFKSTEDSAWRSAKVPGCVHLDLMSHGLIEDPYYRLNERKVQWIDKKDWEYQLVFEVGKEEFTKDHLELIFEGLDTYASVFLNGKLVLTSDNMHRRYSVEVKEFVQAGKNTLHLVFHSPIQEGLKRYDALDYTIPVSANDQAETGEVPDGKRVSVHTRKAGYHYGWDWGPRLVTSGIWRPITLRSWNALEVRNVKIDQNLEKDKAELLAHVEVVADKKQKKVLLEVFVDGKLAYASTQKVDKGNQLVQLPFTIQNPELWWPNGLGDQKLYSIELRVSTKEHSRSIVQNLGLRSIALIAEKEHSAPNFYFKVNGQATFAKGVNYIPQDVFLPRVSTKDYERLLTAAKEANMNMVRVWGGGVYEDDRFYALCDSLGLMVWQDFMFACAMYPGDKDFLENVRQEAIDNIRRLRSHPCIALWCGNNENLAAWKRWGWEQTAIETQSEEIAQRLWNHYDTLFHHILPEVVAKEHADISYWSSSPSAETGVPEEYTHGDTHYWGVWWGKEPFENYNTKISSFMSEYGFQSFPEYASFQRFASAQDRDMYSEVMKAHQRSSIGNATIEEYLQRSHRKPIGFEELLYMSQVLQADGIQTAIEAHRRNKPQCYGSLYWQLNDCWPGASWSSIDYYGKWKALHYKVREAFAPVLVSHAFIDSTLEITVVSDRTSRLQGTLRLVLSEFKDIAHIVDWQVPVDLAPNSAEVVLRIPAKQLPSKTDQKFTYLRADLLEKEENIAAKNIFFKAPKDLELPPPNLSIELLKHTPSIAYFTVRSENFAKGVHVTAHSPYNFSDNFFDLPIQGSKVISLPIDPDTDVEDLLKTIELRSLWSSRR